MVFYAVYPLVISKACLTLMATARQAIIASERLDINHQAWVRFSLKRLSQTVGGMHVDLLADVVSCKTLWHPLLYEPTCH